MKADVVLTAVQNAFVAAGLPHDEVSSPVNLQAKAHLLAFLGYRNVFKMGGLADAVDAGEVETG